MPKTMPAQPDWMKVQRQGLPKETVPQGTNRVNRESHTITGYVVAEEGEMKDGRGFFSRKSIEKLIELGQASADQGVKMRFQHPQMSDDGLSKFLGRGKNLRPFETKDGRLLAIADAELSEAAAKSPAGDLRDYVETLAETDPDAFGTSIVAKFDWFDKSGRQLTREQMTQYWENMPGQVEWIPTELHASDVVAEGNAVTSFFPVESLSALPDGLIHQATAGLDQLFAGQPREVVETRCMAFLKRYVDNRYGVHDMSTETKPADTETPTEVTPVEQQQTAVTPTTPVAPPEQQKPAKSREREILEVCQIAGCPERALSFIGKEELSAADVKDMLFKELSHAHQVRQSNVLPPENGGGKPQQSAEDKLKAEVTADFQKNRHFYDTHGITENDLFESAKIDAMQVAKDMVA